MTILAFSILQHHQFITNHQGGFLAPWTLTLMPYCSLLAQCKRKEKKCSVQKVMFIKTPCCCSWLNSDMKASFSVLLNQPLLLSLDSSSAAQKMQKVDKTRIKMKSACVRFHSLPQFCQRVQSNESILAALLEIAFINQNRCVSFDACRVYLSSWIKTAGRVLLQIISCTIILVFLTLPVFNFILGCQNIY